MGNPFVTAMAQIPPLGSFPSGLVGVVGFPEFGGGAGTGVGFAGIGVGFG